MDAQLHPATRRAPAPGPGIPKAPYTSFLDVEGLRLSGIFPPGKEPAARTIREWCRLRRIPYHKVGRDFLFDPAEVAEHIRRRCKVEAR